jgi:hypothetical protein
MTGREGGKKTASAGWPSLPEDAFDDLDQSFVFDHEDGIDPPWTREGTTANRPVANGGVSTCIRTLPAYVADAHTNRWPWIPRILPSGRATVLQSV